jgi:hypothetical protein
LVDFVLGDLSFRGENLGPFMVVPGNVGFLFVVLLKALSGDWMFFRVNS